MKLISQIEIDHFRSVRDETITALGDFTALAGPNNSGKSNILRALNAFLMTRQMQALAWTSPKIIIGMS
jgi:AAA15 family ATPase/GTPase